MEELVNAIRQAAVESVEAQRPVILCYGLVENTDPLQIRMDQMMVLQREMLILPADYVPQVGQCCLLLRVQGGQQYALLYVCAGNEEAE